MWRGTGGSRDSNWVASLGLPSYFQLGLGGKQNSSGHVNMGKDKKKDWENENRKARKGNLHFFIHKDQEKLCKLMVVLADFQVV